MDRPAQVVRAFTVGAIVMAMCLTGAVLRPAASAEHQRSDGDAARVTKSGRPGKVKVMPIVRGTHYLVKPCGYWAYCWYPALSADRGLTVGPSKKRKHHKRKAQYVTITRLAWRSWDGGAPWSYTNAGSQTKKLGKHKKRVTFNRWSVVPQTGFGYYAVTYTLVWRKRSGRLLGSRSVSQHRFVCDTHLPCSTGSNVIYLADTGLL